MPFGDLIQRQDVVDDRTQAPCLNVPHDLVQFGQATHGRAEDREQFEEDEAEVEGDVAAGRRAAGDEASAAGERTDGAIERVGANVLDAFTSGGWQITTAESAITVGSAGAAGTGWIQHVEPKLSARQHLGSSVKTEIEERVGLFLGIRAPG